MDLAINSLNNMRPNAPEWVLMPGRGDFAFLQNCDEMAAEWYANELNRKQENDPDKDMSGGEGQFDDHEDFEPADGDGDSAEKQIADKRLADAVAKAAKECDFGDGQGGQPKGWGSVSHQIKKNIKIKKFNCILPPTSVH